MVFKLTQKHVELTASLQKIGEYIETKEHDLIAVEFGDEYPHGDPYYVHRNTLKTALDLGLDRWPMIGYLIESKKDLKEFMNSGKNKYFAPTSKYRKLIAAVKKRDLSGVREEILMSGKWKIDPQLENPLMKAAKMGYKDIVLELLESDFPRTAYEYQQYGKYDVQNERVLKGSGKYVKTNVFDVIFSGMNYEMMYEVIPYLSMNELIRYKKRGVLQYPSNVTKRMDRYIERKKSKK